MEERGDGGRCNPPAKQQRGWAGGVNIAHLLPNPAWAIVPPSLLDVIKDFSHTTKRAEGTNALVPSPPVGEAMTRRLGAGAGKTQGKLGSMLIQLISQRGWRAGGGGVRTDFPPEEGGGRERTGTCQLPLLFCLHR